MQHVARQAQRRRSADGRERPWRREPPGEDWMSQEQLGTGGGRRWEVLREGAESAKAAGAASPRAGVGEALREATERLGAGVAGEPDAEGVTVKVGPRRDGREGGRAEPAGRPMSCGRAWEAAMARGAVQPVPEARVSGHTRKHAVERVRARPGRQVGGGSRGERSRGVDWPRKSGRRAARAELQRRRSRQETVRAVARWGVEVTSEPRAHAHFSGRAGDRRTRVVP